jgi:hypothetical protein
MHARPPLLTISTIPYKVDVYATAERADTLPLFLLYPYMYSVIPPSTSCLQWGEYKYLCTSLILVREKGGGVMCESTGSYTVSRLSCWGEGGGGDVTRVEGAGGWALGTSTLS